MLPKEFNYGGWGELHHPHRANHEHATGVGEGVDVTVMRSYRISKRKLVLLSRTNYRDAVENMLKMWLYRYAKHGHIAVSDSLAVSLDREDMVLYIHYRAIDVPKRWACMFSAKNIAEMTDRAERDKVLSGLSGALESLTEELEGKPPGLAKVGNVGGGVN